ncbi:hypothetical protein BpHYR1_010018 [Brachionus plicatilis]|uniref:Secreted protein n=1 Tax=Brachionus plicatilis TaxID=10195 RepID=A0A3M7QEV7_BRAPC|nr:hypothetical protein BpHYR1_010018 [Brachionus plicatilis]
MIYVVHNNFLILKVFLVSMSCSSSSCFCNSFSDSLDSAIRADNVLKYEIVCLIILQHLAFYRTNLFLMK